tara:strand:+ start:8072 stop:8212 length:141 start_codon:yes stop_codon:yes gene_type:complete
MPKKRKLNSKNPKYLPKDAIKEPIVLEKKLLNTKAKHKAYAVFLSS